MEKIGLEIHQRLESNKLFCSCYYNEAAEKTAGKKVFLERRMRAVTGESGLVDAAASFEEEKNALFEYGVEEENACLVESDEEPPHKMNVEALKTVVAVALALKATPLDEVHVMRKTVVDGSAVSGFQRTALVAVGGSVQTIMGSVAVQTVCVEEESAGIVEKKDGVSRYDLDRLGVPLIEIATDASIRNAKHCREVAEKIGGLLRATGRVQRGIGSIRQDVNVSIEGGSRVEIKGCQSLELLGALVENEVLRQKSLLKIHAELKGKTFVKEKPVDASSLLAGAHGFVGKNIAEGKVALVVKLAHLGGLLTRELMPSHRLGTELSDYARAAGVNGIIHGDEELGKYGITEEIEENIRSKLHCGENDSWTCVVAKKSVALKALDAVAKRAALVFDGVVPKETRRAQEAISKFMRPLPGAARMYPETDVPPIAMRRELLEAEKIELPEERVARYGKLGLTRELAKELSLHEKSGLFEKAISSGADATTAAVTLLQTLKALKRDGVATQKLSEEQIVGTLLLAAGGKITRQAVGEVLRKLAQKGGEPEKTAEEFGLQKFSEKQLLQVAGENNFSLQEIMRKHRLNVDAGELAKMIAKRK